MQDSKCSVPALDSRLYPDSAINLKSRKGLSSELQSLTEYHLHSNLENAFSLGVAYIQPMCSQAIYSASTLLGPSTFPSFHIKIDVKGKSSRVSRGQVKMVRFITPPIGTLGRFSRTLDRDSILN